MTTNPYIRQIRSAPEGPEPSGPYSQVTQGAGIVLVSGQIPIDPQDGTMPATFPEQVRRTLKNLEAALSAAGVGIENVLKVNTFLTERSQLDPYNREFASFFGDHRPARTTVCVELWDVALEIECLAVASISNPESIR